MSVYDKYDFNDYNVLLDIVKRDKYSFLEGACTEHIFFEEILKPRILNKLNKANYSTGWWRTKLKKDNGYTLFKVSLNKPCSNDIEIGKIFSNDHNVYFLFIDESNNLVIYDIKTNSITSLDKFMIEYKLDFKDDYWANAKSRIENRQSRAIEFLNKNNLLKEYAFQRFFVNFILGSNIVDLVNIDGILSYEENDKLLLKVMEIKFKYPTKNNKFGLNEGFRNLFNMMLDYNIPVVHYILNNYTKSENFSIIDVLTTPNIKSKCSWIYANITKDLLDRASKVAPSKTRYNGKFNQQKYIPVDTNEFKKIKDLEYNYIAT